MVESLLNVHPKVKVESIIIEEFGKVVVTLRAATVKAGAKILNFSNGVY